MKQNLGKLILLKEQFIKNLENNSFEDAETLLKVINEEYKKIGKKSLVDILNSDQIANIEKCFGKSLKEIVGTNNEQDNELEPK